MKNRKLMIVSFLVVATMIVGVGFANVTGSLSINGNVDFYGYEMIQDNVAGAVSFTSYEILGDEDICTVTLGSPNELGAINSATVDVNFYDKTGDVDLFSMDILFTIGYGEEADALPVIHIGTLESVVTQAIENQPGEFSCNVVWADAATYEGDHPEYRELEAGETVDVIVTISYAPDYENVNTAESQYSAGIRVAIPFSTECPAEAGGEG